MRNATIKSIYLSDTLNALNAVNPAAAFAAAWSQHEATLKYHRLPLSEWRTGIPKAPRHLSMCESDIALSIVLDQ